MTQISGDLKSVSRLTGKDKRPHGHFLQKSPQQRGLGEKQEKCYRCGRDCHTRNDCQCPAKSARCKKCSKIGHFAAVCRSTGQAHFTEEAEEELYLGMVIGEVSDPWKVSIQLEGLPGHDFKLDTGADVTVIPEGMILKTKLLLEKSKKRLYGPRRSEITVLGKLSARMSCKEKTVTQDGYSSRIWKSHYWVAQLFQQISFWKRFILSAASRPSTGELHPLYKGLGQMTSYTYKIHVQKDCKPYAITSPRRLVLPLQGSQRRGGLPAKIWSHPTRFQPTDWCAPIVVVQQQGESVRGLHQAERGGQT